MFSSIISKHDRNFGDVDNDPPKNTDTDTDKSTASENIPTTEIQENVRQKIIASEIVTATEIQEKLRGKIKAMGSRVRDSAVRCKVAREKLVEARERESRTKEYRKELRVKVIETEETLKLKERALKDLEERVRYKDTFVQDSRKITADMTEIQVEVDKMSIQLSAATRKYNDSYREWQKIRAKHKELDQKLREKENEGADSKAKTEQLKLRLQATKEGIVRMEREQAITAEFLEEQKAKNHEVKVKYKQAWERKLEAMKKIEDLEARIVEVTKETETVQKERQKAEEELILGYNYTKFEGEYTW